MHLSPATQRVLEEMTGYRAQQLLEVELEDQRRASRRDRQIPALLCRALGQMASPGGLHGAEREYAAETARAAGVAFDLNKLVLPVTALSERTLVAATDNAGGYLVGTDVESVTDALRPWSVTVAGGVTVLPNLGPDTRLPITDTDPTVSWSATETTAAPVSDPVLDAAVLTPKIAAGVVQYSKQVLLQSGDSLEAYVRSMLARVAGQIIDTAVLAGSGASGQPTGILNQSISNQSGTSLAWSGLLSMKKNALDVGAQEERIAFIGDTASSTLLEGRTREVGGGVMIWQDGKIANCAAYACSLMPASTLICGPLERVVLGLFGPGLELAVNPFQNFQAGIVAVRVSIYCDVALACAAAGFTKSASIT